MNIMSAHGGGYFLLAQLGSRKHDMKRYPHPLRTVNMRQTGRISNDGVRDEWPPPIVQLVTPGILLDLVQVCPIARLMT